MKLEKKIFGLLSHNEEIHHFTLSNNNGISAGLTNYGGIITSILVPDRDGEFKDVVLGFEDIEGYLAEHPYIGTLVGRVANRIAKGRFTLSGNEYRLVQNHGQHHIHGGLKGFDKVIWDFSEYTDFERAGIMMNYTSFDMEEGYPGLLKVQVHFSLNEDNELAIEYTATTDKPTPVNLTHHGYFNLNGAEEKIYDHELFIPASRYVETDDQLIPTGSIIELEGGPEDFRNMKPIGKDIDKVRGGYDHCYILDRKGDGLELAARVVHPGSGRIMEVYTTEPAIQFYSSNFLEGLTGKGNIEYTKHLALCLETEHYPDSVNHPEFPSIILQPGETYKHVTIHKFLIDN